MAAHPHGELATTGGFGSLKHDTTAHGDIIKSIPGIVAELRATFKAKTTKSLEWRKSQLRAIKRLVIENHEAITLAVRADHKGAKLRGIAELGSAERAQHAIDNLDAWAAPDKPGHNSLVGKSYVRKDPKGVILMITPWNYPVSLVLEGMVCILAAGNCVVVKPSEVSKNCAALLAELIPKYFDLAAVRVVLGGVPETTELLKQRWDHIMYTGNGFVGRIVMKAAAEHLTPTTLELGGKSPVYIDKSAKISTAVCRIALYKWTLNAGQTCIAPDYLIVHADVVEEFKKQMVAYIAKYYSGENLVEDQYGRIIDGRHVDRIRKLLEGTSGKILIGGECHTASNFVSPTLVDEPDIDDAIMTEEIFGPLLAMIAVKSTAEAIAKIDDICSSPLALYIFSETQSTIDEVLDSTASGGVCVNGVLEHIIPNTLPFGGIGESGHGCYHGEYGFKEFTHMRGVYVKDTTILTNTFPFDPPPYKDGIYDLAVKMNVTGFLSWGQKLALKASFVALVAYFYTVYDGPSLVPRAFLNFVMESMK